MASAVSNLLIYQGSDFNIDFTVENDNGTPFNLTGYTVACVIKKHYTSSTSTTVQQQFYACYCWTSPVISREYSNCWYEIW